MDFGLVKAMEGSAALTSQGTLLGSPEYMAPEQADPDRAAEIGPATDRYALGILAYEMLTGRVPFPGNTPGTLNAHEHKPVPPPRSLRPDMSEPVEAALLKMLAKAPSERFTCARDFTARLREALMTASQLSRREAQLAPLYARLQQAAADKDWTEVLALGGQIAAQDAPYRDVPAWMEQARAQLRRPPPEPKPEREPRKPLPLWVWGILGAVMFIACGVGLATVVPALLPTATPTRRTPTVTVMTVIPRISTVTPTSTATSSPTSATTPVATHTPITGTTTTRTVDGMVMVYVPAGEFLMGNDQGGADDEKPQREVYLDAFWIDRTEVTNAQYKECVQANLACKASSYAIDSRFNGDNQPVVGVDWNDAKTYCEWVGGALPTEAQWEKAARGTDGRAYPWGNNPITGKLLNFCDKNCEYNWKDSTVDDGYAKTAPVGSYLAGASPYGAWDMAGNVWEWVADWYDAKYYAGSPSKNPTGPSSGSSRVLRGGSWYCNAAFVRAAFRSLVDPGVHHGNLGFRCVGAGPGE
jgi:formylglycine-generating enzyme required for sulfatase activity